MLIGAALAISGGFALYWELTGADQKELESATVRIERIDAEGNLLSFGSGSIIRDDGLILTNAHVADPAAPGLAEQYGSTLVEPARLIVSLFQGERETAKRTYVAKIVASDGFNDIALLQIVRTLEGEPIAPNALHLPTVPIGDSDRLDIGEDVRIIGYPGVGGGDQGWITSNWGIVSGFYEDEIKTDAQIFQGHSGGVAADKRGRLVGIPSSVQFEVNSGLGTAGGGTSTGDISATQGRIISIKAALPMIEAVRGGRQWTRSYVPKGTGKEQFDLLGWATEPLPPDRSCPDYSVDNRFAPGQPALVAVFSARGMAANEDLQFTWRYAVGPESSVVTQTLAWEREWGTTSDCFYASAPVQSLAESDAPPDGHYAVQVHVGPKLRLVESAEVVLGNAP